MVADTSMPREEVRAEADFAGADETPVVDGPVHRPLIRATLPRVEGQKDARPAPDFTIRHTPSRGSGNGHGGFRGDRDRMRMRGGGSGRNGNAFGQGNGNRPNGGPRFQGNRPPGSGRQPMGRAGGPPSGFRGNGNGQQEGTRLPRVATSQPRRPVLCQSQQLQLLSGRFPASGLLLSDIL